MIRSARWSRTEPKSVPEVENKENPTCWAMNIMKYLDDKFIVAIKGCIWEQIERIFPSFKLLFS